MPLSIEGSRTGRKFQETLRSFRTKGSASKLFETEGSGPSPSLPKPSSRQSQEGEEFRHHRSPPNANFLGPLKPSSSRSRASSRNNAERLLKSRQKTPGSSRLGFGGGHRTQREREKEQDTQRYMTASRETNKSRSRSVKKERRPIISREGHTQRAGIGIGAGYEYRPASRSASRSASRLSEKSEKSPATSPGDVTAGSSGHRMEQSLESITLSDYMSNLLRKNHNKSRQSTPQSDLGDEDVRPQSVEHLEMQCDIEDNTMAHATSREGSASGRLRSMLSRGQSRKGRPPITPITQSHLQQQNWLLSDNRNKEFEIDFRPATPSDRIASRIDSYSDPHLSIDNHVATKEVDLSALSADFFSPTKKKKARKKPISATKRVPSQAGRGKMKGRTGVDDSLHIDLAVDATDADVGLGGLGAMAGETEHGSDREVERDEKEESSGIGVDYPVVGSRRKPQSARAMLEGWQKRMNEMERPPSRQRPPPESLHLYAEGFATRISNVKRPSTAVSPSRHSRQNESDSKLFAAYYMKKDPQSIKENLRNQSAIKYSSYEGDSIRAPSRRGRKKRVKEAFTKES